MFGQERIELMPLFRDLTREDLSEGNDQMFASRFHRERQRSRGALGSASSDTTLGDFS